MTLAEVFADERIRFFLRNRNDIKAWAAIEADVMAATRELLQRAQPLIDERLADLDPNAIVGRRDGGSFERILVRRDAWPASVGVALEWSRSVDPLGGTRPKVGVFWWADPPSLVAPRSRLIDMVMRKPPQDLGFKVPLDSVWPVGAHVTAKPDWWQDPDAWVTGIVDVIAAVWPLVDSAIDEVLIGVEWQVSDG